MQTQTQVYTHNRRTHTQTHTHADTQPYPTLLCSCVKWARGLISWKHTTEPEEKWREGNTQQERREEEKAEEEQEKDWEWGRCHVVCMPMNMDLGICCRLWRSLAEPLSSFCSSITPLHWPQPASTTRSDTHTHTHTHTHIYIYKTWCVWCKNLLLFERKWFWRSLC